MTDQNYAFRDMLGILLCAAQDTLQDQELSPQAGRRRRTQGLESQKSEVLQILRGWQEFENSWLSASPPARDIAWLHQSRAYTLSLPLYAPGTT